jgi:polysaccharide export outer membrane protein
MRFSRMLGPTEALADRALLQSVGGEFLRTGERSDGLESFAGPARGRTSRSCPLLIACIAITLAACGTAGPGGSPYHASGRPEGAAVTPAVGVPARATGTPAPGGQPPAAGPESTSAALNLRLLAKAGPSGGDGDLPVGPGDLIEVSVFEVEELSKLKLRIPARGMISLPLIGQVQAAGRTATELEDEIRTKLQQKYMHDPQVSVFVHEHNSQRVSVMGAVRRGGVITLNRQLRLADALATAEGLADDAHHVVYVIRQVPAGTVSQLRAASAAGGPGATSPPATSPPADAKGEVMTPIDLSELADGRDELNVSLRPGDVIHVPRAGSFYVGGSVERSGSFLLKEKTTLQQAILAAGGVKNVADWTDIRLYRKTPSGQVDVTTVDLNAVEEGQAAPELRPNDVVIVGKHAGKAVFYGFLDFFKGALGVAKGF